MHDMVPLAARAGRTFLCLVEIQYTRDPAELYQVPVALAAHSDARRVMRELPGFVIAQIDSHRGRTKGVLYDAVLSPDFGRGILNLVAHQRSLAGEKGLFRGAAHGGFQRRDVSRSRIAPRLLGAEQSNTSIVLGERLVLKLFRRLRPGANPEVETARFLAARNFPHVPRLAGTVQYQRRGREGCALAILNDFVPNSQDGWQHALAALDQFFKRLRRSPQILRRAPPSATCHWLDALAHPVPALAKERLGAYFKTARLLGERTADLHLCLASARGSKDFVPEPFRFSHQRALLRSVRREALRNLAHLRSRLDTLPAPVRAAAIRLLNLESQLMSRLRIRAGFPVAEGWRLRVHGDYHLGQLLHTGRDLLIIDFEGEPARSLNERRAKHSPLRDVAGLLRSFDYAAFAGLRRLEKHSTDFTNIARKLRPWARFWAHWAGVVFLNAYLNRARAGIYLPARHAQLRMLLDAHLIQKALYELSYELHNRPDWVSIPLRGLGDLIKRGSFRSK